jgi:hypothetical protein
MGIIMVYKPTNTGWWFGTFGLFFHSVGNFIIPTDFHSIIFQRGRSTTNQPANFWSVNSAMAIKGCEAKVPWKSFCCPGIWLATFGVFSAYMTTGLRCVGMRW